MQLTILTKPFAAALKAVLPCVSKRSVMPVLSQAKFTVGHTCTLTATDLERTARIDVVGVVPDSFSGSVLFPAARMAQLLATIRDEFLTFNITGQSCEIRGARCVHKIPLMDVSEFPSPPKATNRNSYSVPSAALRIGIKRTCLAVDDADGARYALGGVFFDFSEGLHLVGTDGRAMSMHHVSGKKSNDMANISAIVPADSLTAFIGLMDGDELVNITVQENDIRFGGEGFEFTARLLEGRFPRWRDAMKQAQSTKFVSVPAGEFLAAVNQAAFANGRERKDGYLLHPGVDVRAAAGELSLSAETENGKSDASAPVAYDAEPVTVRVGSEYVTSFLRAVDAEASVIVGMHDAESAMLIEEGDTVFLVMPMVSE